MASAKIGEDAKADNDIVNAFKIDTNHVFQKDRNARCAPDTGQWFFHHPEYEAFRAAKGPQLLFVTAEAGGGKSTVMRALVDQLQGSDARPVVAYFFFKDDDDQLRSYEDALSSMIYQLFVQELGLIKHARDLYQQYGHGIRYQTKEMWTILQAAATETHREFICVLDAADECAPAGRRQLVSDLAVAFECRTRTATVKLKFVVTSRPYQDENHPYTNLIASNTTRHLAGENARVQSDIQSIIRFKAEELAKKHRLTQNTLYILIEAISSQNLHTRSFMAVRMAFELLDSHDLMREGAEEDIIRAILADIPQTLGDQFDKMLNKSPNKEHARRLFCVILAARKTLKIPELKVLYALTHPRDPAAEPLQSYDDLHLPANDDEFKRLIQAQCGLFITFVRSSVHLFHQTAREYLMASLDTTGTDLPDGKLMSTTSGLVSGQMKNQQRTWKGCITKADANLVMLTACTDLFNFKMPRSWVLHIFDSLNAGNGFHSDIEALLEDKPVFQYAAFNWYEHAMLGGDDALVTLRKPRYASVLDIGTPSFWVWFLVLADYICTNSSRPESIISSAWEEDYKKLRLSAKYGTVLRDACLTKLFDMDLGMHNLLDDPSFELPGDASHTKGPIWTAGDGYDLIDRYHLAYGEYECTSFAKAVQCIENGQCGRADLLSIGVPTPKMIWTCITDGAPIALKSILSSVNDIDWLEQVPEHIMYRRRLWYGWSSRTGKELREKRELGWTKPWPPALAAIVRAMNDHPNAEVFLVLADWLESSAHAKDYAQLFWKAGGFLEPSFCRGLIKSGAAINVTSRYDGMTALHVAASLWEHDSVDTLIELGADPTTKTSNGLTALHLFLSGPESIIKEAGSPFSISSRLAFQKLPAREKQRLRKARILSTLEALCKALPAQSSLNELSARGESPLMLAVKSFPTATEGLIRAGANIEQADQWGRTSLMHFFHGDFTGRSPKTLMHLLNAGADSSAHDAAGHSILDFWVRQVSEMDLSSLYPGFNRFNKSFHALTSTGELADDVALSRALFATEFPLAAAARLGNTKLCWALCMAGADPNKHGLTTKTRLPENSGSESSELQELSWRPLLIALMHAAYTTAAILLSYGADVMFKTPPRQRTKYNKYSVKTCGTTALHVAVRSQSLDHVGSRMSLNTGCLSDCTFAVVGHPERRISKENTVMRLAEYSRKSREESDSYKQRFKDESSDSEYDLPKNQTYNENTGDKLLPYDKLSKTMLQRVHEKLDDPLYFRIIDQKLTAAFRQAAIVELLLKKGAPVNVKTQEGRTPLHVAVDSSPHLVQLLLKYGTDANVATEDGITPLMQAASRGDRELVEILLVAGADPDAQLTVAPLEKRQCSSFIARSYWTFRQCDSPLTAMAVAAGRGHYEVVELLLQHGADPNKPIEHHAHGRLPSKRDKRRLSREYGEPDSSDSEVEPEEWKGYISIGTALSWARDEVRELLLRYGADAGKEQSLRECDCAIIEKRKERGWIDSSDDDLPANSDGEDSDSKLRRHHLSTSRIRVVKWDGDTDDSD